MTTRVEKSIIVNVPVSTRRARRPRTARAGAYNQWTQFEDFPHFMGGVKQVTQLADDKLRWVAEIAGVKREWEAVILEQVPDEKVAWAATSGATNAGAVHFEGLGGGQTRVYLSLEYEPEGLVETVGDKLSIVERRAEADLEKFKAFIEDAGYATGAWRGTVGSRDVGTPGVEAAEGSRGDSGKAGVSAKAVAAGAAAAAVGVAAAGAMRKESGEESGDQESQPTSVGTGPALVEVTEPEVVDDDLDAGASSETGARYADAGETGSVDPSRPV
jgi:uncharacterized membrane protein